MTTEKQILANRANCLKSTGPRTEEGKRLASRNATVHGLLAGDILIKGESAEQYEIFRQRLRTDLDPVGQLETLLAERITAFFWRLARAGRMEQGLLDLLGENPDRPGGKIDRNNRPIEVIIRRAESYEDDPEYQEFLRYKEGLESASDPETLDDPCLSPSVPAEPLVSDPVGESPAVVSEEAAPIPDEPVESDAEKRERLGRLVRSDFSGSGLLERLLRYEGQIERSLYRALAELQKLQFIRKRNEAIFVQDAPAPQPQPETQPWQEPITPEQE